MNGYLPYFGVPVTVSDSINNPYFVTQASDKQALDLNLVKDHLAIDRCDNSQDTELTLMIQVVADYVERYTRRTLLTTQFLTLRNGFPYCISLRKSKFQELIRFQYYLNGVLTTVDPSLYQITRSNDYVSIVPLGNNQWPTPDTNRLQSVEIEFTAGYGSSGADIPISLKMGMLNHIAALYANRGDCSCDQSGAESALPANTKLLYDSYKIMSITGLEGCC